MKQKRYVIALLLAAVVISGVSYVSAEAHNSIGETPAPTQNPNITVTVEVGPPPVYINMSTELPASYTPDWKPGDWWILQISFHPQSWPTGWNMYWQKYEVVKCEEVVSKGGTRRTFYKVTTAHSDNSTHWTDMYFMKDNTLNTLSLYRVETHDYHRGKMKMYVDEYGTIDYPAPVTPTFGSPLDVPVFPLTTEKSEESYEFVRGHAPIRYPQPPEMTTNIYKIKQEVAVSEVEDKGPGMFLIGSRIFTTTYKVTLTNVYGTVTQYWHPSAPWALYEPSADWTVHLTGWGSSEQPEEVSVVSEENSSEWWISEPEEEVSVVSEENSEPVKGVIYRKGSELAKKSSVPVKGVTYRRGSELPQKSSVPVKGVTYRKGFELAKESSEPVKGVTYRRGSELPQKSSVPVKGVTYRKGYELPQESSAPFKGIYLPKK